MSDHRRRARDAVIAGLAASPRFASMAFYKSWARNVDAGGLPGYTVSTPREPARRQDKDTLGRYTTLIVMLKREGGNDIEDVLDLDAAAAEAVVPAVLKGLAGLLDLELENTEFALSGEGAKKTGRMEISFTCHFETPAIDL